jgi:hypothetical protein
VPEHLCIRLRRDEAVGSDSRHHPWAALLWRVFQRDAVACPRCDQPMKVRTVLLHSGFAAGHPACHPQPRQVRRPRSPGTRSRFQARAARRGQLRPTPTAQPSHTNTAAQPGGRDRCVSAAPQHSDACVGGHYPPPRS